jgi:hypothetical protein
VAAAAVAAQDVPGGLALREKQQLSWSSCERNPYLCTYC